MTKNDLPRILQVTPELDYLPMKPGERKVVLGRNIHHYDYTQQFAKSGGLADMTSTLAIALKREGANVAVTLPRISRSSGKETIGEICEEIERLKAEGISGINGEGSTSYWPQNLFLADHSFFRSNPELYSGDGIGFALAFQSEVLNKVIHHPNCEPDLVHTHDWTTGLVAALSDVPTLHTMHNVHTKTVSMHQIYEAGISLDRKDRLWLDNNDPDLVNLQLSAMFSAYHINTPSTGWKNDIIAGDVPENANPFFRELIIQRIEGNTVSGILNAPDPSYAPETDRALEFNYNNTNLKDGKKANKKWFQEKYGLKVDENAPLIVWTNRLDPVQKGIPFFIECLHGLMQDHQDPGVQVAIIADGPYKHEVDKAVDEIKRTNPEYKERIIAIEFSDKRERRGYAAADAAMNVSLYAPCELVQMKAALYGTMPIVRGVGGVGESVAPLSKYQGKGDKRVPGVVMNDYNTEAVRWGLEEFLKIYHGDQDNWSKLTHEIKTIAEREFTVSRMARDYIDLYSGVLGKPIVRREI